MKSDKNLPTKTRGYVPSSNRPTDDDFSRAIELLKEDENMEKYYEKKYSHESK